jgi:hypothetical protein
LSVTVQWAQWYAIGTVYMHRLMQAEGFLHISVKLWKLTTSDIQKDDDSSHIQNQQQYALHSYASIPCNVWCSWSVLSITISTLVSYVTYLSLIIFKIIPHPMTLLTTFPLQVIIPYLILYYLFLLAYYRITYPLPCSHIPSPHVLLTHCLNPFS